MHDPYGEADLVAGGYLSTALGSGKPQRHFERNWGRRWRVEGKAASMGHSEVVHASRYLVEDQAEHKLAHLLQLRAQRVWRLMQR